MSSKDIVRVGVIGSGAGEFHLKGYGEDDRAEVVAIAGLDTDRVVKLANQYGVKDTHREYQEMLARDDIDAVSVAVPNFLHMPVALAAFEAGKHVLVEKPLARNAAEGVAMVEAARAHNKVLGVSFQRRTRHDVQLLKHAIDNNEFGNIYYAKAWWMRRSGIPGLGSWFTSKEAAGGGPLIDLGVHVLDMLMYVMGNPEVHSVTGTTYAQIGPTGRGGWPGRGRFEVTAEQPYEVEDLASAFIRLKNGGTVLLEASWASFTEMVDDFGIQVYGPEGGARIFAKQYALTDSLEIYKNFGDTTQDSKPRTFAREGHGQVIHSFIDSILNGAPMQPSGLEGLANIQLIDAIYKSAALGREVILDEEIAQISE